MAEQFIQACQNGDMAALVQVLDPAVWGDIDLGPLDRRNGQGARGQRGVSANLLRYFGPATLVSYPVGGHPTVLAFVGQKLWAVILLTVEGQTREENPCDRRPGEDLLFECPPGAGRLTPSRLSRPPRQSEAAPRSTGRPATGGLGGWTSRRLATFPLAPPPRMSIPPGRQAGPQ